MLRQGLTCFLSLWLAVSPLAAYASDAERIGSRLGSSMGSSLRQDFNSESKFREKANEQLGLGQTSSKGKGGEEASVSVARTQEKRLSCYEGEEFGLAGVRVRVDACEKQGDQLEQLQVALCDGTAYGRNCYANDDAGFSQTQAINLGKGVRTSFSGGTLNAAYGVSAWCDAENGCRISVTSNYSGSFGHADERQRADSQVQGAADHVLHNLADIRRDGDYNRLEAENQKHADHFPTQVGSLYAEGIVRSLDGNTVEMGLPEDCGEGREEVCQVSIPTQVITCNAGSKSCDVARREVRKTCEKRAETETVLQRVDSNSYGDGQVTFGQFESIASVSVYSRHSKSACTLGSSFGVRNNNTLWVSHGCRATFTVEGVTSWHDGCVVHRQRAPGASDPENLPSHPDLDEVAECYLASDRCLTSGTTGCVNQEFTYACYGEPQSSCNAEQLEDDGWHMVEASGHANPTFPGYDESKKSPIRWTERWVTNEVTCPDDPGYGCGPAFDITDTSSKKRCYTGPTPACGTSDGNLFGDECLATQNGVCVQQQQRWMYGSSAACQPLPGVTAATVPFDEGAFSKALAMSEMMDQMAEHGAFDEDGQFRLFMGEEHTCSHITSNFRDLMRAYSVALTAVAAMFGGPLGASLAAAASGGGMGVINEQYCCEADPSKINAAATFGYCRESDVHLATARMAGRAVQVTPGSVPTNNTFCMSYASFLPMPPAKGAMASANQICSHWTRPHTVVSRQIQVDRYQRWCEFDSMLGRLIQEQGREQLKQLAATNTGGAQSRSTSFPFFGRGGWTDELVVNGNRVRFWQWDESCTDPDVQVDAAMTNPLLCSDSPDIHVAICSAQNCGEPPADPVYYHEDEWEVHELHGEDHTLQALTRYVVMEGGCFDDGGCDYQVHAWPAGSGGQMRIPIEMSWPLRGYESGWDQHIWSHNNIHFRPFVYPIDAGSEARPRLQYCIGTFENCSEGGSWQEVAVPDPVTSLEHQLVSAPKVTLLGECKDDDCNYRATVHVQLTAKPWYSNYSQQRYQTCMARALGKCITRASTTYNRQYTPDCQGFTLDEFMALDIGRMDLSEYIETLSMEAKKEFLELWD